jgi:uncharacterized protein (TIGR03118 family)
MHKLLLHRAFLAASLALVLGFLPSAAKAQFKGIALDSNVTGHGAHIDPNLVNAWGIAFAPTGAFWVSDEGTGLSTLYDGKGNIQSLVVTIPPAAGTGLGSPTGIIFNSSTGFKVTQGTKSGAALFIFDTLDGTISGWSPTVSATKAIIAVNNSSTGAMYTGLAFGTNSSGANFLFAADSSFNDRVDIYDSNFSFVKSFTDTTIPPGITPYGIQNINGQIFVSFANPDGSPGGYIDIFDVDGNFVNRFASNGTLSQPWGMAVAPASYAGFSNALLVSNNLPNGTVNGFNLTTGASLGPLLDINRKPIVINQLWGIAFGGGSALNGQPNQLFFTGGPVNYGNGVFGVIAPAN